MPCHLADSVRSLEGACCPFFDQKTVWLVCKRICQLMYQVSVKEDASGSMNKWNIYLYLPSGTVPCYSNATADDDDDDDDIMLMMMMFVCAVYGLPGGNAPQVICWLCHYINCLFVYLTSLHSSFLILLSLLIYFLTHLLPDLFTHFQNRRSVSRSDRRMQLKLTLVFLCQIFVVVFCYRCMFAYVVFYLLFQHWVKRLAGKNVSDMTYFMSGGMQNLKSVSHSLRVCVCVCVCVCVFMHECMFVVLAE